LVVHPILAAYLSKKSGILAKSLIGKWNGELGTKLKLKEDATLALTQYQFYDRKTEDVIKL
jgi:hypothetical protein